jgi:Flp pilus assembly protein TadG
VQKAMTAAGRRDGERGQGTVEFALVLIPFLLLLLGIFDLGRAVFYQHMLTGAAREGARLGVVATRTADEICARAGATVRLPGATEVTRCGVAGALTVTVSQRGTPGAASEPVAVSLSYVFSPVTPLVGAAVGERIVLSASSTMYVEA